MNIQDISKEKVLALAEKVRDGSATEAEAKEFFESLNVVLKDLNDQLDEAGEE